MSNGYDKYFKAKKENKKSKPKTAPSAKNQKQVSAEDYLRDALKVKTVKSRSGIPWSALIFATAGLAGSIFGFAYPDKVSSLFDRIQVSAFNIAVAADPTEQSAKAAAFKSKETVKSASTDAGNSKTCPEVKAFTEEELSHFNKLGERKKELDLREAELSSLETELHKQKAEIEQRIVKLEQIRRDVASTLKERVDIDEQRVGTLVDFYSNMKPKQAAEIFGKLNEDLAVEILGKMKKKNAAEILNLLEPVKARVLSEKFTGYKRR